MSSKSTFSNSTSRSYALALYELANENSELEKIEDGISSLDKLLRFGAYNGQRDWQLFNSKDAKGRGCGGSVLPDGRAKFRYRNGMSRFRH